MDEDVSLSGVSTGLPPPSYASIISNNNSINYHKHQYLGFPSSYFLIQSKNTTSGHRVLDVRARSKQDGTEICLHTPKEPYLDLRTTNSLRNEYNNQLFFLTWDGTLSVASSPGSIIDAILPSPSSTTTTSPHLILTSPQPILSSEPTRESHPFPQFSFDPETETIQVLFACDPTYGTGTGTGGGWMETEYVLESVPTQKSKPGAGGGGNRDSWTTNFVGGLFSPKPTSTTSSTFSLPHSPTSPTSTTKEEGSDYESDSEPDAYREIRLIPLPKDWRSTVPTSSASASSANPSVNDTPANIRKWSRRQFEILPITLESNPPTSSPFPSSFLPFSSPFLSSTYSTSSTTNPSSTTSYSPHPPSTSSPASSFSESQSQFHQHQQHPLQAPLPPLPSIPSIQAGFRNLVNQATNNLQSVLVSAASTSSTLSSAGVGGVVAVVGSIANGGGGGGGGPRPLRLAGKIAPASPTKTKNNSNSSSGGSSGGGRNRNSTSSNSSISARDGGWNVQYKRNSSEINPLEEEEGMKEGDGRTSPIIDRRRLGSVSNSNRSSASSASSSSSSSAFNGSIGIGRRPRSLAGSISATTGGGGGGGMRNSVHGSIGSSGGSNSGSPTLVLNSLALPSVATTSEEEFVDLPVDLDERRRSLDRAGGGGLGSPLEFNKVLLKSEGVLEQEEEGEEEGKVTKVDLNQLILDEAEEEEEGDSGILFEVGLDDEGGVGGGGGGSSK